MQDSFRYTEGVVTEGVKVDDVSKEAPAVADEEKIVSRNQVGEKEWERKTILEEKRTTLHRTAEYLGAARAVRGNTNSYDGSALRALSCGPTRIGTCLTKIGSTHDSNGVIGVSNSDAFVTDHRYFAFDPWGYLAKFFYLLKLLLSKPLVDRWGSLPIVENNLDGEVSHKLYKGRNSLVLCPFDPGGYASQSFRYRRLSLLLDFHLEDKVIFNHGGVDTCISI